MPGVPDFEQQSTAEARGGSGKKKREKNGKMVTQGEPNGMILLIYIYAVDYFACRYMCNIIDIYGTNERILKIACVT